MATTPRMTPNQLVAYNLRRARLAQGWTLEEAARQVEPYLGVTWKNPKASWASLERSAEGAPRKFSADELVAFAQAFGEPVASFLMPPPAIEELPDESPGAVDWRHVRIGAADAEGDRTVSAPELVELIVTAHSRLKERLMRVLGDDPSVPAALREDLTFGQRAVRDVVEDALRQSYKAHLEHLSAGSGDGAPLTMEDQARALRQHAKFLEAASKTVAAVDAAEREEQWMRWGLGNQLFTERQVQAALALRAHAKEATASISGEPQADSETEEQSDE